MSEPSLTWEAGAARLDRRPRYAHVTLEAKLQSAADAQRYLAWVEATAREIGAERVLEDARRVGPESAAILDERARWALSSSVVVQIARVLASEDAVLQTNMRAVSAPSRMRGFVDLTTAHRWLCHRTHTFSGGDTMPLKPATRRFV